MICFYSPLAVGKLSTGAAQNWPKKQISIPKSCSRTWLASTRDVFEEKTSWKLSQRFYKKLRVKNVKTLVNLSKLKINYI